MERQRIEFTLEEDTRTYATSCHSLTPYQRQVRRPQHFNCLASFPASFATELHVEAYWKHLPVLFFIFTAAFRVFEVILQLSYTCVKAFSKALNGILPNIVEQGISTGEMLRTRVELTRALLGQSAQAQSVNWNPHQYQTWRLCRTIGGVTMEINSPD